MRDDPRAHPRHAPPAAARLRRHAAARRRPRGRTATGRTGSAQHADEVVAECSRRSLQTNEPLRCAALLPALSSIEGPIALLEVGASAGLCLYPDRYSYRYRGGPRSRPGRRRLARRARVARSAGDRRCGCRRWCGGPASTSPRSMRPTPTTGDSCSSLVWPGEEGRAGSDRGGARHRRGRSAAADRAATPPIPGVLESVAAARAVRRDARRDHAGSAPAHPARRPRTAADRYLRPCPRCGSPIDPPGLHERWQPPVDAGHVGRLRPRHATACRSRPSTHSAHSWSGAPTARTRRR